MGLISKMRSVSFVKYLNWLFCIVVFFTFPLHALANGAVAWSGINGNELAVSETKPFNNFIVDEEVTIDGVKNIVSVKYIITNTTSAAKDFTMVFPIADYCTSVAERESIDENTLAEKLIKFEAKLDGTNLSVEKVEPNKIKLDGEYIKLKNSACTLLMFKVKILTGSHILSIKYNLVPGGGAADGIGYNWKYNYSIWPAKNWVPKFRYALWRVILPQSINHLDFVHVQGDWYGGHDPQSRHMTSNQLYERTVYIDMPGNRHDYPDHIDYTADDFIPKGQISIEVKMRELQSFVEDCEELDKLCEIESLKSLLKIRPFVGNKRCYDLNDLNVIKRYMELRFSLDAIPILRNEIFARKGYIFKTETMKNYFSEMLWYKPESKEVGLNDIEKWNVTFLKSVEDAMKSQEDEKKLSEIYHIMKKTCP